MSEIPEERNIADDEAFRRALRRSLVALAVLVPAIGLAVYRLNRPADSAAGTVATLAAPEVRRSPDQQIPRVPFPDVTTAAGIRFVHCNGAYGDKLLPETMGGGCAVFDYNNDGHQELLLVNSCYWPGRQPQDQPPPTMALDRDGWMDVVLANDTVQNLVFHNQRDGTFEEIGAVAGTGTRVNRDAVGAWIEVRADQRVMSRGKKWPVPR